jgi:hypothetical protein
VSVVNQIANSPEIARNIEEKVAVWRIVAKIINVSTRRHPNSKNPKLVRD